MVIVMTIVLTIVMASVMASVVAINYPGLEMANTKIHSLMEVALKNAGGEGYYVLSGKEDLFDSLSISLVKCQQNAFIPSSSKTYEERNELKGIEFQLGGDRTGSDSREEKMEDSAEGLFNGTVTTIDSDDILVNSKTTPPRLKLRRETGYVLFACKYEVSLKINCDINFSNWRLWNLFWWSSWNNDEISKDYKKTVSAYHVLSMVNGWNEKTKTVKIELEFPVETEIRGIYIID